MWGIAAAAKRRRAGLSILPTAGSLGPAVDM
jgi:hypothetical protein